MFISPIFGIQSSDATTLQIDNWCLICGRLIENDGMRYRHAFAHVDCAHEAYERSTREAYENYEDHE